MRGAFARRCDALSTCQSLDAERPAGSSVLARPEQEVDEVDEGIEADHFGPAARPLLI